MKTCLTTSDCGSCILMSHPPKQCKYSFKGFAKGQNLIWFHINQTNCTQSLLTILQIGSLQLYLSLLSPVWSGLSPWCLWGCSPFSCRPESPRGSVGGLSRRREFDLITDIVSNSSRSHVREPSTPILLPRTMF